NNSNVLRASELAYFKNSLASSYSRNNFRISSIPLILYSNNETREIIKIDGFNAVIKKNNVGDHTYFIKQIEYQIKNWRKNLLEDLEILQILDMDLNNFHLTSHYKTFYKNNIANNSLNYFALKTKIVSEEFIKLPTSLYYDWIILQKENIER